MLEDDNKVLAVERTMKTLECLVKKSSLTLTEISREVKMHKTTLSRFLYTLCSLGYVYKDEQTEQFALTEKINSLFTSSTKLGLLQQCTIPFLEQLSDLTKETIHLATLENQEIIYLHKIESTQSLRVVTASRKGGEAPIYCTGLGKALLSCLPKEQQLKVLNSLSYKKYTKNTITDHDLLLKELTEAQKNRYAIDNEEHEEGIYCIAAPIVNSNGEPLAAISITGPAWRMKEQKQEYLAMLAEKISEIQKSIL